MRNKKVESPYCTERRFLHLRDIPAAREDLLLTGECLTHIVTSMLITLTEQQCWISTWIVSNTHHTMHHEEATK